MNESRRKHTDRHQPDQVLQPHEREDGQGNPQRRDNVHAQPEEALVSPVLRARGLGRRLKDPVAVARRGVDFVPPSQADQAAAGDVLEVVKVDREEQEGQDEDEDEVADEEDPEEVHEEASCHSSQCQYRLVEGRGAQRAEE